MSIFATILPAIIGGAQNLLNNAATTQNNQEQREWAEHMYDRQRNDALTDRDFQNNFNSPAATMQRLKGAGLNPNLVYGNGAAVQQAAPVRSSSVEAYNPQPQRYDMFQQLQGMLALMYDMKMKDAQIDLVKENIKAVEQNKLLTEMKVPGQVIQNATAAQAYGQATEMNPISIEQAKQNVKKSEADTQYTLSQNERASLTNAQTLEQGALRILQMRKEMAKTQAETREIESRISNLKNSNELQELDLKLKRLGIQPSDNMGVRIITQYLNGDIGNGKALSEKLNNFFFKFK